MSEPKRSIVTLDSVIVRLGQHPVLDGTSFSVEAGMLTVVVGPSGCGKTTLLRLIAGLIDPAGGTLDRGFVRAAMVFQDHRLLPWRCAVDNVAIGMMARMRSVPARRERARRLLMDCGLTDSDLGKYPAQLSGGMKARVAIARALAAEPDLVLLDEPFSGLDFTRRLAMQNVVRRLVDARGVSAIFVTHDLAEAVRIADQILVMAPIGGRIATTYRIAHPMHERDAAFVRNEVMQLLALPAVADSVEDR